MSRAISLDSVIVPIKSADSSYLAPKARTITPETLLNLPAIGIPIINYSPESTMELGAAAQAYFQLPNQKRTSIVQLDGTYSLQNQWYINAQGNLYFGKKDHTTPYSWQLQFRIGYSDRPSTYYGNGNQGNTDIGMLRTGSSYTLQRGYVTLHAPLAISKGWSVGPMADFLCAQYTLQSIPYTLHQYALGAVVQYDTRDVIFYPTHGIFFKLLLAAAYSTHATEIIVPKSAISGHISANLRQYIPLPRDLVIAWQFKSQWLISPYSNSNITMYPLLPRLGGQDGIRGVNSDMFRDDVMMSLQAELRIPLWKIFRATIFAGIGDVYDLHDWHWAIPKLGYGLGLRATINKAKVNIRLDIARSNVDPRWNNINAYSFYLTATEAF